ncbi:trypsin-like serine peptidase [Sorangium sp. So ce1389]|uniref:trypsin-like serine peptidase n=1 Tax=Sorangium sp. So ce1389 TaxID=3133336 RepID=UPI003F631DA2
MDASRRLDHDTLFSPVHRMQKRFPEDCQAPRQVPITDLSLPPHPAICVLESYFDSSQVSIPGTGWFITPRIVITAGHCLYSNSALGGTRFARHIKIFDAFGNQIAHPTATFSQDENIPYSLNFFVRKSWYEKLDAGASEHDYGAILLKPGDITSGQLQTSTIPYAFIEDSELDEVQVTVTGYAEVGYPAVPDDNLPRERRRMCHDTKDLLEREANLLFYKAGTVDGQSGSPVCLSRDGQQICGIGIHTGYSSKLGRPGAPDANVAVRISQDMKAELSTMFEAVESESAEEWVKERWDEA